MRMKTFSRSEEGSMFIIVLLTLLILTAVAIGLVFVTEIEMQMGATERIYTNTFYGSESGLHAALSGVPNQNWDGEKVAFVEGRHGQTNRTVGTRIETSRIHAVGPPELPPMTLANHGESDYHTFSIMLRSTAERVSWPDTETVPFYSGPGANLKEQNVVILSRRLLTVRYLMSPIRTPASAEEPYNDEDGGLKL